MHRLIIVFLTLAFAAALPVGAQAIGLDTACGGVQADAPDCCPSVPSAGDCEITGCAGSGSALPFALPRAGLSQRIADAPESPLARFVAPPARAPDTAPPKSVS